LNDGILGQIMPPPGVTMVGGPDDGINTHDMKKQNIFRSIKENTDLNFYTIINFIFV
jgi:hypothetical protein